MTLVLTCWSCNHPTRLPASYLLVAAVPPAPGAGVGTVAWICRSCAELIVNSVDWTALAALVADGAELIGGCLPATALPSDHRPDHPRKGS